MNARQSLPEVNRRGVLRWGIWGMLAAAAGGAIPAIARRLARPTRTSASLQGAEQSAALVAPLSSPPPVYIRLAATDGFIALPGRSDPLYVFGFIEVPVSWTISQIVSAYKGQVQAPAPIIGVDQEADVYLTMTNLGFVGRPDLDDAHTIHWHGFRNPIALFDGVPEASISVPVARDFPYFYRPHDPGTYMYHCHFEDVEHVQMDMTGIVYVRPAQNFIGAGSAPAARLGGNSDPGAPMGYVYNDGDGSTAYDREFALLLNEIDTRPHDNLIAVQEFMWTDYKANFWVINGRAYPDTLKPNNDPSLPSQPISSLVQVNEGERVLLRFANLGYEQHVMQLTGIPLKVVGEDATLLRGPGGADLSYWTNSIYIGPGEARDVIFAAPAFDPGAVSGSDAAGSYNAYLLKNRNYWAQTNNGLPGLGGMVTEVRVYPAGTLPAQSGPNETYL